MGELPSLLAAAEGSGRRRQGRSDRESRADDARAVGRVTAPILRARPPHGSPGYDKPDGTVPCRIDGCGTRPVRAPQERARSLGIGASRPPHMTREHIVISHLHSALFVHVPKCGGQSVEQFFLRAQGLDWSRRAELCLRRNKDPERGPPRLAHMTSEEYVRLGYLGQDEFERYFKFSFVRNPWARLVSEYRYRSRYAHQFSFKTFVFKKMPRPSWNDRYRHVMPQCRYLTNAHGELLVDFVGRFENLQADFSRVCEALGLGPAGLPRVNVSQGHEGGLFSRKALYRLAGALRGHVGSPDLKDYRAYYDDETREKVAEIYREDIQMFGYEFDPPALGDGTGNVATDPTFRASRREGMPSIALQ